MKATIKNITKISERCASSAIEQKGEIEEFVLLNHEIEFESEHLLFDAFCDFLLTRTTMSYLH